MDLARLAEPFGPEDIEWRIGTSGKTRDGRPWAKILAYLTNRAIMQRLDDVCGPGGWQNDFRPAPNDPKHESLLCGIGIEVDGRTVWKWDGANNTDIESVKGGISDSMKRAAVQWGLGRSLYGLGETWAECTEEDRRGQEGWRYAKTKDGTFWWKPPADGPKPKPGKKTAKAKPPAEPQNAAAGMNYPRVVRNLLANVCKCENEEQANAVVNEVTNGLYTAVKELDGSAEDARKIHELLTAYAKKNRLEGLAHALDVGGALLGNG